MPASSRVALRRFAARCTVSMRGSSREAPKGEPNAEPKFNLRRQEGSTDSSRALERLAARCMVSMRLSSRRKFGAYGVGDPVALMHVTALPPLPTTLALALARGNE